MRNQTLYLYIKSKRIFKDLFLIIRRIFLVLLTLYFSKIYLVNQNDTFRIFQPQLIFSLILWISIFSRFNFSFLQKNSQFIFKTKYYFINLFFQIATNTFFVISASFFIICGLFYNFSAFKIILSVLGLYSFCLCQSIYLYNINLKYLIFGILLFAFNIFFPNKIINLIFSEYVNFSLIFISLILLFILNKKIRYIGIKSLQIKKEFDFTKGNFFQSTQKKLFSQKKNRLLNYVKFDLALLFRKDFIYIIYSFVFYAAIIILLILFKIKIPDRFELKKYSFNMNLIYTYAIGIFILIYGANIFRWNNNLLFEFYTKNFDAKYYIISKYFILFASMLIFFIPTLILMILMKLNFYNFLICFILEISFLPYFSVYISYLTNSEKSKNQTEENKNFISNLGTWILLLVPVALKTFLDNFASKRIETEFSIIICVGLTIFFIARISRFSYKVEKKIKRWL